MAAGTAAGSAGGLFASAVPACTGGIGNLLSGRALSPADSAAFFISQGAVRVSWCAGGLALWLAPGLSLPGGATAWPAAAAWGTAPAGCLPVAAVAILLGAVAGAAAGVPLCAALAGAAGRFGRRAIYAAALATLTGVVLAAEGFAGLCILAAAAAIGTMAAAYRANPANALGVALLPAACALSGLGPAIGRLLGN
jgi:TctA family transporter